MDGAQSGRASPDPGFLELPNSRCHHSGQNAGVRCRLVHYTEPANDYNDENIFVLGSLDPVSHGIVVNADPCREIALHMKTEILRIISELSEPYVP